MNAPSSVNVILLSVYYSDEYDAGEGLFTSTLFFNIMMYSLIDLVSLQAVALDDSDVTVWYHLGIVALKTFDLCLARHSFEEVCSV